MSETALQTAGPTHAEQELHDVLHDYLDVTRRLQQTHEKLQREVLRLRSEVASKDRELERRRRLASLGELAAGVAHEVRNPLGAIQLYSGRLRRACGDAAPMRALIDKIDNGIEAIDAIVCDALALAPSGGTLRARPLRAIIDDAAESCAAVFAQHRVALRVCHADPDLEIPADGTALPRVFVNLFTNAAQASPPHATIHVHTVRCRGANVRVTVADEGTGLPAAALDHIFDPFFTTKESGTGLGLTIAHRLVEAHGGTVAARNRPEGGAEFVIVLPLAGIDDASRPAAGRQDHTSAA